MTGGAAQGRLPAGPCGGYPLLPAVMVGARTPAGRHSLAHGRPQLSAVSFQRREDMKWHDLPFDRHTAIIASITSIVAVVFSWCAVRQAERFHRENVAVSIRHNVLSVRPRLNFSREESLGSPRVGLKLMNDGLGPAEIRGLQLSLDGKALSASGKAACHELDTALDSQGQFDCAYFGPRSLLRASQGEFIIGSTGSKPTEWQLAAVSSWLPRLGVSVCYCSLYDECWVAVYGRPGRALSCPSHPAGEGVEMSTSADAADCNVKLLLGIAGIVGTLLGALGGALVAWWNQLRHLEHEDRTRFHEERLAVYAKFNAACNGMVSAIQTHAQFASQQRAVIRSFETVRLIVSPPVAGVASRVNAICAAFSTAPPASHAALAAQFNSEVAALCTEMRKELGIDHNTQGGAKR